MSGRPPRRPEQSDAERLAALETTLHAVNLRLQTMELQLRQALCFFDKDREADGGRTGAGLALSAVVDFIRSFTESKEVEPADPALRSQRLTHPLVVLVGALVDLDKGQVQKIVAPAPRTTRPTDSTPREIVKVFAAFSVEQLMEAGASRTQACGQVARTLATAGFRLPGRQGAPKARTVQNWRERLRQSRDGWASDRYWKLKATHKTGQAPPGPPLPDAVLSALADFVRRASV
ncbi:MAG: hypothetical protein FJX68_05955 [Alphaproteobacteria bacterium]|nr:hypothetical protein [Alphaproteobacteria bacterium]